MCLSVYMIFVLFCFVFWLIEPLFRIFVDYNHRDQGIMNLYLLNVPNICLVFKFNLKMIIVEQTTNK